MFNIQVSRKIISYQCKIVLWIEIIDQNEHFISCNDSRCGGSTLTASVVVINSGMISVVESITRNEGGDSITTILSDYLAEEFKRKYKIDPR